MADSELFIALAEVSEEVQDGLGLLIECTVERDISVTNADGLASSIYRSVPSEPVKAYVKLDDELEIAAISTFPDHARAGQARKLRFYRRVQWKVGADGQPLPNDSTPNTIRDAPLGTFALGLSDVVSFRDDDRAYSVERIMGDMRNVSGAPYVTEARVQ